MKVSKIMRTGIKCAHMDDTLETVMRQMKALDTHHMLVVDQGKLAGIISDRDVKRFVSPFVGTKEESNKDAFTMQLKAHQIMTRTPISVHPDADIREAIDKLLSYKINALPVTDLDMTLKGIITSKDIMLSFKKIIDMFD